MNRRKSIFKKNKKKTQNILEEEDEDENDFKMKIKK